MKTYLKICAIYISFFLTINANSQNCLSGGIVFSNQSQIDNFSANYPGCIIVDGNIRVEEAAANDILNLNGLNSIEKVGGNLVIFGNSGLHDLTGLDNIDTIKGDLTISANIVLDSLKGLDSLKYIGKNLFLGESRIKTLKGMENLDSIKGLFNIEYNDSLRNFSGINSLKYIGNSIFIIGNPILNNINSLNNLRIVSGNLFLHANSEITDLTGLINIDTVKGSLEIWNNKALTSLNGLNSIAYIFGNLAIGSNQNLTNLNGLNSLDSIGGYLEIINNSALSSLNGMESLTKTGGFLTINGNQTLQNLNGLHNLTKINGNLTLFSNQSLYELSSLSGVLSISGALYIGYNNSLTSMAGLDNIDANSITELTIRNSGNLSICNTPAICEYLNDPANITNILNNNTGCNSRDEIEAVCIELPIQFIDFNVRKKTDFITLNWQVTNEFNIELYELETSYDGENFFSIGILKSENKGYSLASYFFNYSTGSCLEFQYFRVKSINFDGSFSYSQIIYIDKVKENIFEIFPNLVADRIYFNEKYSGLIKVYSSKGNIVIQHNCLKCESIEVKNLSKGTYMIKTENPEVNGFKFIKVDY